MEYTKALADLIEEFQKLPGIGPKSAQRMAFWMLKRSQEQVDRHVYAIRNAKEKIKHCGTCFNLTSTEGDCGICNNPRRDSNIICVVPEVKDLIALERTKDFQGLYHVLGGIISPLDGISADDLHIVQLMSRLEKSFAALDSEQSQLLNENNIELILAMSPSTEGEATILYLKRIIENAYGGKVKITRLAYGLPIGADLDYADEMTLSKALEGRQLC